MGTKEGPSILCSSASLPRPPHFPPHAWFRAEHPGTLAPPSLGLFLCLQRQHRTTIQDSWR